MPSTISDLHTFYLAAKLLPEGLVRNAMACNIFEDFFIQSGDPQYKIIWSPNLWSNTVVIFLITQSHPEMPGTKTICWNILGSPRRVTVCSAAGVRDHHWPEKSVGRHPQRWGRRSAHFKLQTFIENILGKLQWIEENLHSASFFSFLNATLYALKVTTSCINENWFVIDS